MILLEVKMFGREFVLENGQFNTSHWGFERHDENNWTLHMGKLSLVQSTISRYSLDRLKQAAKTTTVFPFTVAAAAAAVVAGVMVCDSSYSTALNLSPNHHVVSE